MPTVTLPNCCAAAGEPQAAMPASTITPMAYNRSFVRKNISVTAASSAAVRAIKQRGARRRQNRPKTLDIGTLHRGCVLNQSDVSLLANGRAWRMDARRTQVSENRMYLVQGARNQICNVDYPFPRRKGSVALRLSGDAIASIAESVTSDAVDRGMTSATVSTGRVFRAVSRHGTPWGTGLSENVVWYVIRNCAQRMGLDHLAPHDLRRTCAKLCHVNGGELEQIQFLLGHASVLTTERYLGCKQNLEEPVNDRFGCLFSRSVD